MRVSGSPTRLGGAASCSPAAPETTDPVAELRELAGAGRLAGTVSAAPPDRQAVLRGAAYTVAWPVVFTRLTKPLEMRRGHAACASSLARMSDDCLDRFEDDMEAVVEDVLTHATKPVQNLEAWIASRLTAATVDGHRRRRGRLGALQRPRLPGWLAGAIGPNPWLAELAVQIMTWVGVTATAGASLWPLDSWAQRRAAVTGDWSGSNSSTVEREVAVVLAAMRTRPKWYADHVERPIGHKRAPLAAVLPGPGDHGAEAATLSLTDPDEVADARLVGLACAAVEAIDVRLRVGEEPRRVVIDVIGTVFRAHNCVDDLDRAPHGGCGYQERLDELLSDSAEINRIVADVLRAVEAPATDRTDARGPVAGAAGPGGVGAQPGPPVPRARQGRARCSGAA